MRVRILQAIQGPASSRALNFRFPPDFTARIYGQSGPWRRSCKDPTWFLPDPDPLFTTSASPLYVIGLGKRDYSLSTQTWFGRMSGNEPEFQGRTGRFATRIHKTKPSERRVGSMTGRSRSDPIAFNRVCRPVPALRGSRPPRQVRRGPGRRYPGTVGRPDRPGSGGSARTRVVPRSAKLHHQE